MNITYKSIFLFLTLQLCCSGLVQLIAQQTIVLRNPSFEDLPRQGGAFTAPIHGWHDCGLNNFPGETPPDIHPVPSKAWEVTTMAFDGQTFLGLVTRYNDTYESLSQQLTSSIQGNTCYKFSAALARSEKYMSPTKRRREEPENFVRPVVLLIYGGDSYCDKAELLGESPAITHADWRMYSFTLQPQKSYKFITIEAFYKTPILEAYNGHILVDKLTDIVPIECPMIHVDKIADIEKPQATLPPPPPVHTPPVVSKPKPPVKPPVKDPIPKPAPFSGELIPELNEKVELNQKIRLNFLYFKADSINLLPESHKVLDELASYLKAYPKTIIEIGGHTNTIASHNFSMELSTSRAKSVQQYLINKGISENRLQYKGYGKSDPLHPDDRYREEWKAKNQRVEIRILAIP